MKVVLGVAAAVLAGCGGGEDGEPEGTRVPVAVVELVKERGYSVVEKFVGVVEARRRARLAFEIAGTVQEVARDEGERVEEGERLAVIGTERLEAQRAELRATIKQAEATLALAKSGFERNRELRKSQVIAEQEMDAAEERYRTTAANLRRTQAQLDTVEVDLAKSSLEAPFAGTIARRMIDEGAVVSPNEPVFELLEANVLEVRAAMAADALAGVEVGDVLTVEVNEEGREWSVSRILPSRDERTQTVDVILAVPDGSGLRDGDLVTVRRDRTVEDEGFSLPLDSLTESSRGLWACYVVEDRDGDLLLDRRDVEVVHAGVEEVFVRGSVRAGEKVVSGGLQKVAVGQRVRIAGSVSEQSAP
ncbi:MAG: efflux RND transporter periplasmic adaptor subunit [Chthoniobacterales bacterium]